MHVRGVHVVSQTLKGALPSVLRAPSVPLGLSRRWKSLCRRAFSWSQITTTSCEESPLQKCFGACILHTCFSGRSQYLIWHLSVSPDLKREHRDIGPMDPWSHGPMDSLCDVSSIYLAELPDCQTSNCQDIAVNVCAINPFGTTLGHFRAPGCGEGGPSRARPLSHNGAALGPPALGALCLLTDRRRGGAVTAPSFLLALRSVGNPVLVTFPRVYTR
mgnify:CR=1 FL=1